MNDQRSLQDQLDDLDKLAAKHGLYDAQDWLRTTRKTQAKPVGTTPERSLTAFLEEIASMPVTNGVPKPSQWHTITVWARGHLDRLRR